MGRLMNGGSGELNGTEVKTQCLFIYQDVLRFTAVADAADAVNAAAVEQGGR